MKKLFCLPKLGLPQQHDVIIAAERFTARVQLTSYNDVKCGN